MVWKSFFLSFFFFEISHIVLVIAPDKQAHSWSKFDSNLEKYICFGIKSDFCNTHFKIGPITNVKPSETLMESDLKSGGKSMTKVYISDVTTQEINTGSLHASWYHNSYSLATN